MSKHKHRRHLSRQCSNIKETLAHIKALRQVSREKAAPPGKLKLDPYRDKIKSLHQLGASERDIQTWLRYACRCVVSKTTVHNYIQRIHADEKKTSSRLTRQKKDRSPHPPT